MNYEGLISAINSRLAQLESSLSSKSQSSIEEIRSVHTDLISLLSSLAQSPDASALEYQAFSVRLSNLEAKYSALESSRVLLEKRMLDLETLLEGFEERLYVLGDAAPETPETPASSTPSTPTPTPSTPSTPTPSTPALPPVLAQGTIIVPLFIQESAGIARDRGFVSSGIPIALDLKLRSVDDLVIFDAKGYPIPGDFRATGFWADGSIQWVQVSFFTAIGANEKLEYKLAIRSGVRNPLSTIVFASPQAMVRTGVADFFLSQRGVVAVDLAKNGQEIIRDGVGRVEIEGKRGEFNTPRRVEIEYAGPLVCYVQVETVAQGVSFGVQHDSSPGTIAVTRRYEFRAGSGIVYISQALKWEGMASDGRTPNAILGEKWVDEYYLASSSNHAMVPGGEFGEIALIAGDSADVVIGIQRSDLYKFSGFMYDPQKRVVSVLNANDKFWIPYRSGAFTTSILGIIEPDDDPARIQEIWAELNSPLRAFAQSSYYNKSNFGPIRDSNLLDNGYVYGLGRACSATIDNINRFALHGLMTYGSYPRYWGQHDGSDEVGKSDGSWDARYYAAFTDYYSASVSATYLSIITSNSTYLDLLSIPAAKRMLHTQIMQSSPEDRWIYDGWAPMGYDFYRVDFNSSHSYFEGLYWYYLLTGDRQVIDVLTKGQLRLIDHFKNPSNPIEGRGAHQHVGAMRFLSIVHPDPALREKFRTAFMSLMEKAIREQYIQSKYKGQDISLWVGGKAKAVGENTTLNLYAWGIWDAEHLWWYGKLLHELNGGPVSVTPQHPWYMLAEYVRTIIKYGAALVGGTGKFSNSGADKWARGFRFTWTGTEITSLSVAESGGETLLYKGDEPPLVAAFVRAAKITGDAAILDMAKNLVQYSIQRLRESKLPLGKIMGMNLIRLGAAVAELEEMESKT